MLRAGRKYFMCVRKDFPEGESLRQMTEEGERTAVEERRFRIYFAPLEGITGYIYRTTYERYYGGIDKYFSPFVVTRDGGIMKKKEMRDILPENNPGISLVPQLLTNQAENFIQAASQMEALGYSEVNLNLGCPSGTVVSKGRGAGFLGDLSSLERFLEEIFDRAPCEISIKTRIGVEEAEEFPRILQLFNQYPVKELIVHPRTRRELYRGVPHWEAYAYAHQHSSNPLCYNGDVTGRGDLAALEKQFPGTESVMAGRGFLCRPGFCGNGRERADAGDKETLQAFLGELLRRYQETLSGDFHVLQKMKELWIYLAVHFTHYEKYLKKIKKTNRLEEYLDTVALLFEREELDSGE